ncbi:hypothetical protein ABPG72_020027 [Tetrahymena utriculariae]
MTMHLFIALKQSQNGSKSFIFKDQIGPHVVQTQILQKMSGTTQNIKQGIKLLKEKKNCGKNQNFNGSVCLNLSQTIYIQVFQREQMIQLKPKVVVFNIEIKILQIFYINLELYEPYCITILMKSRIYIPISVVQFICTTYERNNYAC